MRLKLLFVSVLFLIQEVSGQLLTNSGFEGSYTNTAPGWHQITFGPSQFPVVSYTREDSIVHSGTSAQRIEVSSLGDGATMLVQDFDFAAGEIYKADIWLRSNDSLTVAFRFQERNPVYHEPAAVIKKIGPSWQVYTIRGGYRSDISTGDSLIGGRIVIQPLDTGVLFVDNADLVNITDSIYNAAVANTGSVPAGYFGMHVNKLGVHQTFPAVNAGMFRLWNTGTEWQMIEPFQGALLDPSNWIYDPNGTSGFGFRLDYYVNWILSEDSSAGMIYTMGQTPQWAATAVSLPPDSMSAWIDYVSILGNRYQNQVKYWEIWNEVDYSGSYSGTDSQLVSLSTSAYQVLKAIDSTNKILTPNFISAGGMSEYFSSGGNAWADIVSWHHYFSRRPEEAVPEIIGIRNVMENYGLQSLPLWNTEGAVAYPDTDSMTVTESVAVVSRALIVQWLFGVSNFNWYCWDIFGGGSSNYVRLNYSVTPSQYDSITPAGIAYRETASWLTGAQVLNKSVQNDTWIVELQRPDGYRGWVVWNTSGSQPFSIPSGWNAMQKRELSGNTTVLTGNTIQIDETPVLIENSISVSVAESFSINRMRVYPNPAAEYLFVSCYECNMDRLRVFSLTGKLIDAPRVSAGTLDLSGLPAGVYCIVNGEYTCRFVKL